MIAIKRTVSLKVDARKVYRITKLIVLFLLIGINLCLAEDNYSQITRISLDIKNKPLKDIFREIERRSEFVIFYSDNIVDTSQRVTIKAEKQPITEILDRILNNMNYTYRIQGKQVFISKKEGEQSQAPPARNIKLVVKGQVVDELGETLPGVSVSIKGTQEGTITDANGNYTISVDEGKILVFSYLGYRSQEITVSSSTTILNITLEPRAQGLEEIVVIGMNNQQTKRSVTGSIATIQTKELKQSPVANLSNALAGRLPGLITVQSSGQPGEDAAALYIRGVGTYGNSAPLVVIDGLPRAQADFNQLDVNEIESVTILKDAASSALYGIQGANGVVVVTTKRGTAKSSPEINVTAQFAVQQPIRLPKMMGAYDQALYYRERDANSNLPVRYTDDVLEIIRTNSSPYLYPNVNWFDVVLKNHSFQTQYNLNLSGNAGDRIRYFISGSYMNQGTLLRHNNVFENNYDVSSKFDRYNFRSNIDLDATSMLTLRIDLAGRLESRVGPGSGFEDIFNDITGRSPSSQPVFNPDGTLGAGSTLESPYYKNPYGLITQNGYYTNYTNVMYGTLSAKHKLDFITPGLNAQLFFSFENNNYKSTTRLQDFDSYWYKGENSEGEPIYQQVGIASRLTTSGTSSIQRYSYLDARLNYSRKFKEHNIFAQVLANRTLRTMDDQLPYAYQGLSVHATYDYLSRYFLELNFGYNGSENFPPGKRYGFFPAASIGWLISDEPFMNKLENINLLKLRLSHGVIGNDKIGGDRWLYITDYAPDGGYYFGVSPQYVPGYNENRVGNSIVTWERSTKSNVGLDLALFKHNEIQLSFDVFREKRKKILTPPGDVPDFVAITNLAPRNSGEVLNKGFEVELRFDKTFGDWRLFSTIQFSYAKNKVLENDEPTPAFPYQDLRGYEIGYQLGYKALGLFKNQEEIDNSPVQSFSSKVVPGDIKYMDINNDGIINEFDRVPIKISNIPRYVGGVSFGLSYKGFDISCLLSGSGGNKTLALLYLGSPLYLERWTPENPNARLPIASTSSNNNRPSDFLLQDASYLKIRNAEIGYELPEKVLKPVKIKYARIYINGQNLAVWDHLWLKDKDPESVGVGRINYPLQRIINLGLSLKF